MYTRSYISELKLQIRNTREDYSTAVTILNQLKDRYSRYSRLSVNYNLTNFENLIKEREQEIYFLEKDLKLLLKEAKENNILI